MGIKYLGRLLTDNFIAALLPSFKKVVETLADFRQTEGTGTLPGTW